MRLVLALCALVAAVAAFDVCTIITAAGYPCEHHYANTTDGWVLTLDHIPPKSPNGRVLFFQHGFQDSAAGISLGRLAYILSDNGIDVWLGNNRGNGQSMTNIHYTSQQREFWEFSFDEMAKYDLPAQIDYVLRTTGAKQLTYMGHSEGTTVAFAAFSTNMTLVSLINQYIALAPIAYLGNCQSLLFNEMARYDGDKLLLLLGGQGEFMFPKVVMKFLPELCKVDPEFCDKATDLMWGPSTNINNTRLPYIYTYEPSPTSNKNGAHWAQSIRSMQFQMYDYGPVDNMKIYGAVFPPKYPLDKIPASLKIALFTGGNDYLADPTDVALLEKQLVTPPYVHFEPTYAHCDYIWAENAPQLIYPDIVRLVMAA